MLKGKKTAGRGCGFYSWLAGRALLALGFCIFFGLTAQAAPSGGFSSSSAREGENALYFENRSFGTNIKSGSAFGSNPESGDRSFQSLPMPKSAEPDGIEILPLRPEIYPAVPPAKQPIIVGPGSQ